MAGLTAAYAAALTGLKDEEQARSLGTIMPAGLEMANALRQLECYPNEVAHIRHLMQTGQLLQSAFEIAEDRLALVLATAPEYPGL